MKIDGQTIVAIKYEGNEDMEFTIPDSKMELVRALLWEVCSGGQGGTPKVDPAEAPLRRHEQARSSQG